MKFVLFMCLLFWWCMTLFGMIKSQIKYAHNDLGEDDPVVIEVTDLLGPIGTRLLYTIAIFLSIITDNIILIIFLLVISVLFISILMASGYFILGVILFSLLLTVIHHKIENE